MHILFNGKANKDPTIQWFTEHRFYFSLKLSPELVVQVDTAVPGDHSRTMYLTFYSSTIPEQVVLICVTKDGS